MAVFNHQRASSWYLSLIDSEGGWALVLAEPRGDMVHHLGYRHPHQGAATAARNTSCPCSLCSGGLGLG
jgi:hypothetical protein